MANGKRRKRRPTLRKRWEAHRQAAAVAGWSRMGVMLVALLISLLMLLAAAYAYRVSGDHHWSWLAPLDGGQV